MTILSSQENLLSIRSLMVMMEMTQFCLCKEQVSPVEILIPSEEERAMTQSTQTQLYLTKMESLILVHQIWEAKTITMLFGTVVKMTM